MKNKPTPWLNADVGEGCDDSAIIPHVDAANIACGAHAGDEDTMRTALLLCKRHGIMAGAHPGYPDRANFGRKTLAIPAAALDENIRAQIATLAALAAETGISLTHVKPHGALNHDMLADDGLFARLCAIVAASPVAKIILVPTNPREVRQQAIAREHGLIICWEVFADRAYEANGLLRSRQHADALHHDAAQILAQLQRICEQGDIVSIDGHRLDVRHADSICIHGDHPPSIAAIRARTP